MITYKLFHTEGVTGYEEEVFTQAYEAIKAARENSRRPQVHCLNRGHTKVFSSQEENTILHLRDAVSETLKYIDGGPFKWADFDLILIYLADDGYEYGKEYYPYIKEQLNSQAKHIILPDMPELYVGGEEEVWATDISIDLERIRLDLKNNL